MEVIQRVLDAEPPRKRFRATELPLTQQTRATVDALLHTFKKKGEFDALRKLAYSSFEDSEEKTRFVKDLNELAEGEIERNPQLLGKDRRQAAPLIEGAAERGEVYRHAEEDVVRIIDRCLAGAIDRLREIRRKDIGEAAADEERKRGSKTDAEYAQDSARRREAQRAKIEEERRKKEAEEAEVERKRAAEAEEERKRQEEWAKELEERRERKKRQDAQWAEESRKKKIAELEAAARKKEVEIEAAALDLLIRESKSAAARSDALAKDVPKPNGGKESALAAIMRKEQLEREKAKTEAEAVPAISNEAGALEIERKKSTSMSGAGTPPNGQLLQSASSKVWVREGVRKARPPVFGMTASSPPPVKVAESQTGHQHEDSKHENHAKYEHGGHIASTHHYAPSRYEEGSSRVSAAYEDERIDDGRSYDRSEKYRYSSSRRDKYDYEYSERSRHSRHGERSRSPERRSSYREWRSPSEERPRKRERSRDASRVDYVREHSSRPKNYTPESKRRERSRDSKHDNDRSSHRERRSPSIEKPRKRERSRDPKDIDRYIPSSKNDGERKEYDREEYDRKEHDRKDYERKDYDHKDYDRKDFDRKGYDHRDYDRKCYDSKDYDRKEYDRRDYERKPYDRRDYEHKDHDRKDHDRKDYERKSYERKDYERKSYGRDYERPRQARDGEHSGGGGHVKKTVEIDSYIPSTSIRARRRDPEREKARSGKDRDEETKEGESSRRSASSARKARSRSRSSRR